MDICIIPALDFCCAKAEVWSVWAVWIQGVGSVIAIFVAIWIAQHQSKIQHVAVKVAQKSADAAEKGVEASRASASAAEKSATVAELALRVERPYLIVELVDFDLKVNSNEAPWVRYRLRNVGRMPALVKQLKVTLETYYTNVPRAPHPAPLTSDRSIVMNYGPVIVGDSRSDEIEYRWPDGHPVPSRKHYPGMSGAWKFVGTVDYEDILVPPRKFYTTFDFPWQEWTNKFGSVTGHRT